MFLGQDCAILSLKSFSNKTFKLKANAAVRDAFGCKCIEEEDEAYTANIPTHVLDMALRHSH